MPTGGHIAIASSVLCHRRPFRKQRTNLPFRRKTHRARKHHSHRRGEQAHATGDGLHLVALFGVIVGRAIGDRLFGNDVFPGGKDVNPVGVKGHDPVAAHGLGQSRVGGRDNYGENELTFHDPVLYGGG